MRRDLLKLGLILTIGASVVVSGCFVWRHINRTRIIAQARAPNGVEIKVTQSFNRNLGEPFTTSFYYRKPGETNWNWRYYCHEDWYWGKSRVDLDEPTTTATFYREGKPTIRFNWTTKIYIQSTYTQSGRSITNGPQFGKR